MATTANPFVDYFSDIDFIIQAGPNAWREFAKFAEENSQKISHGFSKFWSEIQYSGFDAKVIIAEFTRLAEIKYGPASKQAVRDMVFIAGIGAARGTKIDKIIEKSSPGFAEKLRELKVTYGIVSTGKDVGNARTRITIGRMMACLPYVPCEVVYVYGQKVVPRAQHLNLHRCMFTTSFAAIIPKQEEYNQLRAQLKVLHMQYLKAFDAVINPKKHTADTIMENIQDAAIASDIYPDKVRIFYLKKWHVINKDCMMQSPLTCPLEGIDSDELSLEQTFRGNEEPSASASGSSSSSDPNPFQPTVVLAHSDEQLKKTKGKGGTGTTNK